MAAPFSGPVKFPAEPPDESILVRRARAGDEEAFAELVRRAAPAAIGAARKVTGDLSLAEDAAQEAFVRAYGRLGDYRDQGSFGAWVRKIAIHAAVDAARRRRPGRPIADGDGEVPGERRLEDADLLRRALAALAPLDREILLAREVDGETDPQIAARSDCP